MGQLGAAMSDAEFFAELDGHLVKVEMSNRRKATLTEIFAAMDTDHDGNVSLDEYRAAVASTTMRSFFEYIDGKGVADGFLTLGEWLAGMSEIGASMSDAEFLDELKKLLVDLDIPVGLDKASRAGDDIAAGEGPLQPSISASRWSLGLMWDELLPSFPAAAAEAAAAAFRSLPGATAAAAPLDELLCRLLPADEAVALGCHPPGAELPWGGYVQWLADFFANRWDADAGPDAPFARLMRALAADAGAAAASGAAGSGEGTPVAMRAEVKAGGAVRLRAFAVPEPAADARRRRRRRRRAATRGCARRRGRCARRRRAASSDRRRSRRRPPTRRCSARRRSPPSAASCSGSPRPTRSATAAAAAEEDGGGAAALHDTAARVAVGGVLASRTYGAQVVDLDELLHSQLPVDLHVRDADDVLQRTYRIEMLGALRVADKGAAPPTTRHDAARCHVDDWDYFLHEKAPRPATELLRCLRWLEKGSVDVLARAEVGADGAALEVTEALLERPFEAGVLRCTLTKVRTPGAADTAAEEAGAWLLSGLQVRVRDDYLPAGPLETWHDTEPFGDAPPPAEEEKGEEQEGEGGEPPAEGGEY